MGVLVFIRDLTGVLRMVNNSCGTKAQLYKASEVALFKGSDLFLKQLVAISRSSETLQTYSKSWLSQMKSTSSSAVAAVQGVSLLVASRTSTTAFLFC